MQMTRAQWRQIAAQATTLAVEHRKVEAIKLLRSTTGCSIQSGYHAVNLLLIVKAGNHIVAELQKILRGGL